MCAILGGGDVFAALKPTKRSYWSYSKVGNLERGLQKTVSAIDVRVDEVLGWMLNVRFGFSL